MASPAMGSVLFMHVVLHEGVEHGMKDGADRMCVGCRRSVFSACLLLMSRPRIQYQCPVVCHTTSVLLS